MCSERQWISMFGKWSIDQGGCRTKWHNCIPQDIDTSCRLCLWINRNLLHHFSFYLYSAQTSNVATWSGLNFKTNVEVVLFKSENVIKTIWWLSVTSIAWGNHLGSLSYRQLVSMSCGMQLCHLVLHPPWSIYHLPNIEIHCLSENIGGVS
jgi:hypothetical protein